MGHDEETHWGHEEDRPAVDAFADEKLGLTEIPGADEARQTEAHGTSDHCPPGDEVTEAAEDKGAEVGTGEYPAGPDRQVAGGSCLLGSAYIPPEDQRIRTMDAAAPQVSFETEVTEWIVDASARIRKMRQNYHGLPLPLRLERVRRDVQAIRRKAPRHLYRKGLEFPPYELNVLLSGVVQSIGIRHITPNRNTDERWGYTTPELWRGLHERLTEFISKYGGDKSSQDDCEQATASPALYAKLRTMAAQIKWVLYSNSETTQKVTVAAGVSDPTRHTSVGMSSREEADEAPGERAADDDVGPVV